jgi:hypothetical protein
LVPEVQVGGIYFDDPQAFGREPLDSGSVVVDTDDPLRPSSRLPMIFPEIPDELG